MGASKDADGGRPTGRCRTIRCQQYYSIDLLESQTDLAPDMTTAVNDDDHQRSRMSASQESIDDDESEVAPERKRFTRKLLLAARIRNSDLTEKGRECGGLTQKALGFHVSREFPKF